MKALRTILGLIRKADQKFDFFHENDKVMIGGSGGKDSMVLIKAQCMVKGNTYYIGLFSIISKILSFIDSIE